jgi:tetratricopeptide (TPR) repeat protein
MAQCAGITKAGTPCQISVPKAGGYCHVHRAQRRRRFAAIITAVAVVGASILGLTANMADILGFFGYRPFDDKRVAPEEELERKAESVATELMTAMQDATPLFAVKDPDQLIRPLTNALEKDRYNVRALLVRGQLLMQRTQALGGPGIVDAFKDFKQVTNIDDKLADPHFGIGLIYYYSALFDMAQRGRYTIGQLTSNETATLPYKVYPDGRTRILLEAALSRFQRGLKLKQDYEDVPPARADVPGARIVLFPPDMVSALVRSTRSLLQFEPPLGDDDQFSHYFFLAVMNAGHMSQEPHSTETTKPAATGPISLTEAEERDVYSVFMVMSTILSGQFQFRVGASEPMTPQAYGALVARDLIAEHVGLDSETLETLVSKGANAGWPDHLARAVAELVPSMDRIADVDLTILDVEKATGVKLKRLRQTAGPPRSSSAHELMARFRARVSDSATDQPVATPAPQTPTAQTPSSDLRDDPHARFINLLSDAQALLQQNKVEAAQRRGEEALKLARLLREPTYEATALGTLVGIYGLAGHPERAMEVGFQALTLAAAIPDPKLCSTIHGDVLLVYGREVNKLTREFQEFATTHSFAKAHDRAAVIKVLMHRLGDPGKLASLLAAEAELYRIEGKHAEQARTLAYALDVATHGGAYDVLPKLIELSTASMTLTDSPTGSESPTALREALATLLTKSKAARSVYDLSIGQEEKLARVASDLEVSRISSALAVVDPLLKQLEGTEDYVGLAAAKGAKAHLMGASGNVDQAVHLYLEAIRYATRSGNARFVWPLADNLMLIVRRPKGFSPGSPEERILENAESSLSRELRAFVARLAGKEGIR